ncbi:methyltransferase, partial [Achromatium sp. WMS3]
IGLLVNTGSLFTDPISAILGATLGYMSFWSLFQLFYILTGKQGMGYGDFKLLAMLGAWLGWQSLPQIILLSSCTGAIIGIMMIVLGKHQQDKPIPFGPYLAIAGWMSLLWGNEINALYYHWIGLN